ncbi:MAG: diaminopimelate decarboxylase [Candidatus Binatia bacterium]|nr:MAG: diaminopimelate decarboxylase [Candidatus Binatia bacterium]
MGADGQPVRQLLARVAEEFGTPAYVYFMPQIRQRIEEVRQAFGGRFRISYAVKSNPNPELLRRMRGTVDLLDVSSAGEIERAVRCGWPPSTLTFTGPGKTDRELEFAVRLGVGDVVLESLDEARLLSSICIRLGVRQRVLVRLAPRCVPRGFGVHMSGKPTQFGVDEEDMEEVLEYICRVGHLDVSGFHAYSGTQCLRADAIAENYEIFADLFRRASRSARVTPRRLVFGSGLGIPYHESDRPLDLAAVAGRTNARLDALRREPEFTATEFVLETGRYLVGEAGVYLTRVVRTKRSRGTNIALCDGGMNHHLGAAGLLGSVIHRNYRMFKVTPDQGDEEEFTLVGPLCTTIDTLGRGVKFRGLGAGDLVGIECSGAYGLTASPIHFIGHPPPREVVVDIRSGRVVLDDVSQFTATFPENAS